MSSQSGQESIIARLMELQNKLKTGPQIALREAGKIGETHSKKVVAKKTGKLMKSIRADTTRDTLTLGGYTDYAKHVEQGTSRMPPRPYIFPGMQKAIQRIPAELNKALRL
jgi:HK97 gp10 family phage protein